MTQYLLDTNIILRFSNPLDAQTDHQVIGKRTHDVRIVAVMIDSGIKHIMTLNSKDFIGAEYSKERWKNDEWFKDS